MNASWDQSPTILNNPKRTFLCISQNKQPLKVWPCGVAEWAHGDFGPWHFSFNQWNKSETRRVRSKLRHVSVGQWISINFPFPCCYSKFHAASNSKSLPICSYLISQKITETWFSRGSTLTGSGWVSGGCHQKEIAVEIDCEWNFWDRIWHSILGFVVIATFCRTSVSFTTAHLNIQYSIPMQLW